jgi:hypothetical protein
MIAGRILRDPVAGIFVLEMNTLNEEQNRISFFLT